MKDQYGRKIEYMRVSVTDRCNLRCIYCMPETGICCVSHEEILRFDEIERVCRIAAGLGISRIKLTGGEPLVRRGLPSLLGMLKKIPGIEQVTLTTNGILLKEHMAELAANGLDAVNISIDTLDEEKYRRVTRGGDLRRALEGLEAALACPGLRVKINCVPLADADPSDWISLAELAEKRSVDVRFIEMMPVGLGRQFAGTERGQIIDALEGKFGSARIYRGEWPGNGPAEYLTFPGFAGKIGFISAMTHKFCSTCNRIRLTPEGYLKACLQYDTGADLRKMLRGGSTDEELRSVMEKVIYEKPACHHFEEQGREEEEDSHIEKKEMARIGG